MEIPAPMSKEAFFEERTFEIDGVVYKPTDKDYREYLYNHREETKDAIEEWNKLHEEGLI